MPEVTKEGVDGKAGEVMFDPKTLKLGDEVAYKRGQWNITTVTRVLATQIVTADHCRWTKRYGSEVGSPEYARVYLCAPTPEIRQAAAEHVEKRSIINQLKRLQWEDKDLATLRRIKSALDGEVSS